MAPQVKPAADRIGAGVENATGSASAGADVRDQRGTTQRGNLYPIYQVSDDKMHVDGKQRHRKTGRKAPDASVAATIDRAAGQVPRARGRRTRPRAPRPAARFSRVSATPIASADVSDDSL